MWNDEPTQNFRLIGGRFVGEPAFQKNCEGLEVAGKISNWNGRRWGAPIGLKFCVRMFLGRGTSPSNFVRFARAVWEMLQNRGGWWARHARSWDIWRALALSEGTSLKHERDTLVRF